MLTRYKISVLLTLPADPTNKQLQTGVRENQEGRAHRVKAFVRVDDKKELINPPRFQEKEIKELRIISL